MHARKISIYEAQKIPDEKFYAKPSTYAVQ